jgi:hypothetical protein
MSRPLLCLVLSLAALPVFAGLPTVEAVRATPGADGWRFDVTVLHADTGWDHYADGWEVLGPDGARLGYRALLHPHVTEQPFTRSLSRVAVPEGVTTIRVRAHDAVDGWGPAVEVPLP